MQPNGLGLYDIIVNVSEWRADWHSIDFYGKSPTNDPVRTLKGSCGKVVRGGSIKHHSNYCRSAFRLGISPHLRFKSNGFRLVMVIDSPQLKISQSPGRATQAD